jgi:hypothetical protein
MIDIPSFFAPREKLEEFLAEYRNDPEPDHPSVKRAVAKVQGYLAEWDQRDAASAKN